MKNSKAKQTVKTLPAYAARKNFGELLEEVYYQGDSCIIERAGKPMAKIVPLDKAEKDRWRWNKEKASTSEFSRVQRKFPSARSIEMSPKL